MAVIFGAVAVGQSSSYLPDISEAKIATNRLFKLIDSVPSIDSSDMNGKTIVSWLTYLMYKLFQFNYNKY